MRLADEAVQRRYRDHGTWIPSEGPQRVGLEWMAHGVAHAAVATESEQLQIIEALRGLEREHEEGSTFRRIVSSLSVGLIAVVQEQRRAVRDLEVDMLYGGHVIDLVSYSENATDEGPGWIACCYCDGGTTWQPTREAAIAEARQHLVDEGCSPDNFVLDERSD